MKSDATVHWTDRTPRRLVVAYDGSEASVRAARFSLRLVTDPPMEVWFVHATTLPASVAEPRPDEELASEMSAISQSLQALKRTANPRVCRVEVWIREGSPADVVLEAADEVNADLIVVGTRGLRGARRLVLGSVSEAVVARSHRPVVVVP